MLLKRSLKLLHELGTVGLMGGMAAQMVLAAASTELAPGDFAVVRRVIVNLSQWLLLPSLMLVLVSGAFSIAAHKPFLSAEWALVKALMTPLVLEGTFLMVIRPAKAAAKLSAAIAEGTASDKAPALLAKNLRDESWGLWIMMVLFLAQIVLAIWRPRLRPRRAPDREITEAGPAAAQEGEPSDSENAPMPAA